MFISIWVDKKWDYFCNYEVAKCDNVKVVEVTNEELDQIMTCTHKEVNWILQRLYNK